MGDGRANRIRTFFVAGAAAAIALAAPQVRAQDWRESAAHIGASARVLVIGTRPEDEDNDLIAWLSLGRHVETAYLSITRGESGVNLIGAERQAPLAVVRTAELLAERERDGAHQYFTRAYDFGPVRVDSIVEASWPHDSLLKDVVSVIRAFRPHVVISSSDTPNERDASRRLTTRLVAEAYAAAADSVRFPANTTSRLPAWMVSRLFTRMDSAVAARAEEPARMVSVDVGEFDGRAGRSYAEIGAAIRELQRTQPALRAPQIGRRTALLRLDSSRVGEDPSLFGTLDTTLARVAHGIPDTARFQLDTLRAELGALRSAAASESGDALAARLARVAKRTSDVRLALTCNDVSAVPACPGASGDLAAALNAIRERSTRAMLGAAGIVIDGTVERELVAAGDSVPTVVAVYNGGGAPVTVRRLAAAGSRVSSVILRDTSVVVPPDSVRRWTTDVRVLSPTYHWWQINGLVSGTMIHDFRTTTRNPVMAQLIGGEDRISGSRVEATLAIGGVDVPVIVTPLVHRGAGVVRGDARHQLAGVPATSVLLERVAEYERAGEPLDRLFRVYLWSARSTPDSLAVTLRIPAGLVADSLTRTVTLPAFGTRNVFFRIHGTPRAGSDTIAATARSIVSTGDRPRGFAMVDDRAEFRLGIVTHEYPHIPVQQFVRFSAERIEAVDVRVPPRLRVAYVKGVNDVQPPLAQLRVNVQTLDPSLLSVVDLSAFTTVLIGAGAFANDALASGITSLREFMRKGGTVVVLPAGDEIARSGLLPYPVSFDSVPGRIGDAAAEVHATNARSPLLNWPNVITARDFDDWSSDRARSVPAAFDPRYTSVLSMKDPDQPATAATLLVARVGKGTLVYTSLSLDEQLIAVNPGAARLVVNLLAAGMRPADSK